MYEGIIISSDPSFDISKLIPPAFIPIPSVWAESSLPLVLLPLGFLIQHVQEVSKELAILAHRVSTIEEEIVKHQRLPLEQADLKALIRSLDRCNAATVKLQRRWHFQHTLAATIYELIESYRPDSGFPRRKRSLKKAKLITSVIEYHALVEAAAEPQKLFQSIKYNLEILMQRINNQYTVVRHGFHL